MARPPWQHLGVLPRTRRPRGSTYLPDQDVSGWIRFNLTAYHEQAQTVAGRLDRSGRVWRALSEFAETTGLDERVVTALHDVAVAGRVRRSRYEHAESLSLQQAQRDLRDLTTAQVLEPVGRTRARLLHGRPPIPTAGARHRTHPHDFEEAVHQLTTNLRAHP
ncbi:hypothetical protein MXD63_03505 [Frankia sp. Cpl3]|nr:hypothetical protein [Parafrankia colletiae]MCK9899147.1 hypothetical protein [Frankia sp. Cpl3]